MKSQECKIFMKSKMEGQVTYIQLLNTDFRLVTFPIHHSPGYDIHMIAEFPISEMHFEYLLHHNLLHQQIFLVKVQKCINLGSISLLCLV